MNILERFFGFLRPVARAEQEARDVEEFVATHYSRGEPPGEALAPVEQAQREAAKQSPGSSGRGFSQK